MKVGDVVYLDTSQGCFHSGGIETKIEKIGRKYAYLEFRECRFEIETMRATSGDVFVGTVWQSIEEKLAHDALWRAWFAFKSAIRDARIYPPGLTLDKIAEARRALGMGEGE